MPRRALRLLAHLTAQVASADADDFTPDSNDATDRPYIGGQAVIEGVMMRSPNGLSVAVRRPDESLVVHEEPHSSRFSKKFWKLPGFRGIAALGESLSIGMRALNFSAEQQMTDEEKEAAAGSSKMMMVLSALFAIGLFVALPQILATASGSLWGAEFGLDDPNYHIVIGAFKLLIVLCYLVGISMLDDVRRTFQFHGAEHKTIHAYEKELPLTVENVGAQTTLHPRCGTTFLIVVVVFSIIAGVVFAPLLLPDVGGVLGQLLLFLMRIALLPLIAAFSFEFQRFTARYCTKGPLRALLWPGFLFQKISTRAPSDDQLEVAIVAMEAAAWRNDIGTSKPAPETPHVFSNFDAFQREFLGADAPIEIAGASA